MKLYARLEKKYSENDHVIDEVIRYYTEQEVLNEYWSYWIGRTDSFITRENCITDWLKTYQGWIDVSDDHDTEVQAYNIAQDEILATQHKILDELLGKKELNYNNDVNYTVKEITLKELYDNLAASAFDIIQDGGIDPRDSYYFNVLSFIAHGNIEGIRKAFVDGDSAILVHGIDEGEIEEIRIYDNDKLLMVVVGDEIQY
jgi:hypothetical protein